MSKTVARSWFKMRAENGVGTINILGDIGGFGVNFASFDRELQALGLGAGDQIKLKINSDGGDVYQGFAIYNALKMHPAKISVTVMGLAASMASVIAMAGDTRLMPKNAAMMIHNPVGGIQGDAEEIMAFGEAVGDMRDNIAQAYVDAAGGKLSKAKALSLMDKQSWLGAEQCVALGLATGVLEPVKMAASFIRSNKESPMTTKPNKADAALFEGDDDAAVTAARADERKVILALQKEVNALCVVAGRPELAAKFNEDGKTLSEVVAELGKLGAKKPGPGAARASATAGDIEINGRQRVDTGDEGEPVIDSNAIYDDYNHPGQITARKAAARAH